MNAAAMTRRRFLRLAGLLPGAAGLSVVASGCGGSGGKKAPTTRGVTVTVDPVTIPGDGRRVYSALTAPQFVEANGKTQATVVSDGIQLLAITDGVGALRGLTLSQPALGSITADALSTALTLLFLTSGILTTDPTDGRSRLARLQSLANFPAFVGYLTDKMPTAPLAVLRDEPDFDRLRAACIAEWGIPLTAARDINIDGFSVTFSNSSDGIVTRNGSWRAVSVLRERRDENAVPVPGDNGGVTFPVDGRGISNWSGMFTGSSGYYGVRDDYPEVATNPPVGLLRYIVYGPGRADAPLPAPLANQDPYGPTFLYCLTLPLVDLVMGGTRTLNGGWNAARGVWNEIAAGGVEVTAARDAVRAGDTGRTANALRPVVESSLIRADVIARVYGLNPPAVNPNAPRPDNESLLRLLVPTISPAAYLLAASVWTSYPELATYDLPITSAEVVVK